MELLGQKWICAMLFDTQKLNVPFDRLLSASRQCRSLQ